MFPEFFWVSVSNFTACVSEAIIRFTFNILRFQGNQNFGKNGLSPSSFGGFEEKQSLLNGFEEKQDPVDGFEKKHSLVDGFERKQGIFSGFEEKQRIFYGLKDRQGTQNTENGRKDNGVVATSSKYEFLQGMDISRFFEEPKTESFTLREFYSETVEKNGEEKEEAGEDSVEKKTEDSVQSFISKLTPENQEEKAIEAEKIEENFQIMEEEEEEIRDDVGLETEDSVFPEEEEIINSNDFESISRFEEEDDDDFEYEQLKVQLQIARRGGLPTIAEESEFSKMVEVEHLHPLKMDEKLEYKDQIAKIQKVYRTYLDRMRKLDILNSQTTHAIGLLRLTDLARQNPTGQSSYLRMNSMLPKKIWPFRQVKLTNDRAKKLIGDLELVYVGQMCLSWEILCWQYDKTPDLIQYDPQGFYRYNQVIEELQLFQVLVHRFLENEPFQGCPRVENYAKNRCHHPNFLQIPVVKGSKGARAKEEDCASVTSSSVMLKEIMEESMQVFWEFHRRDRDETSSSSKAPQQRQVAPQDPLDLRLLMNVRGDFDKKEKRLKEMIRSKSCIVKKLQKQQRTPLTHAMFIAQVDLKLVSRVLNMSKLSTDHLVWCHEKLENIKFGGRKLEVEPSILLFPC